MLEKYSIYQLYSHDSRYVRVFHRAMFFAYVMLNVKAKKQLLLNA